MRARARGPRRPRGEPSLRWVIGPGSRRSAGSSLTRATGAAVPAPARAPRVAERRASACHHLAHRVHRFAGAVAVVASRRLEIAGVRRWLLAATRVLAAEDALVLAAVDPALQLAGPHCR